MLLLTETIIKMEEEDKFVVCVFMWNGSCFIDGFVIA